MKRLNKENIITRCIVTIFIILVWSLCLSAFYKKSTGKFHTFFLKNSKKSEYYMRQEAFRRKLHGSADFNMALAKGECVLYKAKFSSIFSFGMDMEEIYNDAMKRGVRETLPVFFSIVGFVFWIIFTRVRIMQKTVSDTITLIGISMILWMAIRLLKWQFPSDSIENRYLWYSYYPFMMLMTSSFLWLALSVGKEDDNERPPRLVRIIMGIQLLLLLLVYTNDLHRLVFYFDLSSPYWETEYSYGYGFFAVYTGYMVPLLSGVVILCIKSWNSSRKIRIIFPLSVLAFMILYSLCYIFRVFFIFYSDLTLIICFFIIGFSESAMRTGMIRQNTKYRKLFHASTLEMRLFQKDGEIALAASDVQELPEEIKTRLFSMEMPAVLQSKENILWFANQISGGKAVWAEDIGEIVRIRNEIRTATARLQEADRILELEKEAKYKAELTRAGKEIFDLMDKEVGSKLREIRDVLMQPAAIGEKQDLREIRLLATYLKRRCSFLFYAESPTVSACDFKKAVEEILEAGERIGMKNICLISLYEDIATFLCLLIYDFIFYVLHRLLEQKEDLILRCFREEKRLFCTIIASTDFTDFVLSDRLMQKIKAFKGRIVHKSLEGAQSLTLEVFCCFEGGEKEHAGFL